jgi:hypothetical protein
MYFVDLYWVSCIKISVFLLVACYLVLSTMSNGFVGTIGDILTAVAVLFGAMGYLWLLP